MIKNIDEPELKNTEQEIVAIEKEIPKERDAG